MNFGLLDILKGERLLPLEAHEAAALLEAAKRKHTIDYIIFYVELHTGISMSELLSLRVTDLDWGGNVIYVKGRKVSMDPEVRKILWAWVGTAHEGYIFPLKERTLMNRIKQYQNVCSFSWRVLRRTYVSDALRAGIAPLAVAESAGISVGVMVKEMDGIIPRKMIENEIH